MRVKVLGSAAGGGFPQWNCACRNCLRLRNGGLRGRPRTQTQLAVSALPHQWFLLNASPDLRSQILATPALTPAGSQRSTPIAGVLITSADVDSVMGLLHLREFQAFRIFTTRSIHRILAEDNHIFRVLDRATPPVQYEHIAPNTWFDLSPESELRCMAVPLGTAYPDYVSDALRRELKPEEATVGYLFAQGGKRFFYAPSLPGRDDAWKKLVQESDLVMIDGTFWTDDELIATGSSKKMAREIGHIPLSGAGGLFEQFPRAAQGRRILIHINNTNPILDEESAEHRVVLDAGFEIAYDGMEFEL
jgi:pyrroloquinoline quinone biosynthesis protein B